MAAGHEVSIATPRYRIARRGCRPHRRGLGGHRRRRADRRQSLDSHALRTHQHRAPEARRRDVRSASQIGAEQPGKGQVGPRQVRACQIRPLQVGPPQLGPHQRRAAQPALDQRGAPQIRAVQARAAPVDPGPVLPAKILPLETHRHQDIKLRAPLRSRKHLDALQHPGRVLPRRPLRCEPALMPRPPLGLCPPCQRDKEVRHQFAHLIRPERWRVVVLPYVPGRGIGHQPLHHRPVHEREPPLRVPHQQRSRANHMLDHRRLDPLRHQHPAKVPQPQRPRVALPEHPRQLRHQLREYRA